MKAKLLLIGLILSLGLSGLCFADDAPAEGKTGKKVTTPADQKAVKTDDAPAEGKTAQKSTPAKKRVVNADDAPAPGGDAKGTAK